MSSIAALGSNAGMPPFLLTRFCSSARRSPIRRSFEIVMRAHEEAPDIIRAWPRRCAPLCYARPIDSFDASGVGFSIRLGARVEDRVVRNVDALGQVGGHEQESVLDPLGVQCLGNCNFA